MGVMKMVSHFWVKDDFDVFSIDGLENRMEALQNRIQPKFELSVGILQIVFPHMELMSFFHMSQNTQEDSKSTKDSWVAFAPAKRGYKALPHFQIGLWGTHLFIILAVIYENPDKKGIAERLDSNIRFLTSFPILYRFW